MTEKDLDEAIAQLDPQILARIQEEAVRAHNRERRKEYEERRRKWKEGRVKAPKQGRRAKITAGEYSPQLRPRSGLNDRKWAPGAVKHWRTVHGLSQRAAQARIGYSARACSWANWEAGVTAPPYETLLRIILATGLGHWTDEEHAREVPSELALEAARAEHRRRLAEGRRRRAELKRAAGVK